MKKKALACVAILSVLILFSTSSHASVRRVCKVSYETQYGWSKEYKVEVGFLTGFELNKATDSLEYEAFSNYALIWFDSDEVAILEIKEFLIRQNFEFRNKDFRTLFSMRADIICDQINSGNDRRWKIKAKEYLTFIDARADP